MPSCQEYSRETGLSSTTEGCDREEAGIDMRHTHMGFAHGRRAAAGRMGVPARRGLARRRACAGPATSASVPTRGRAAARRDARDRGRPRQPPQNVERARLRGRPRRGERRCPRRPGRWSGRSHELRLPVVHAATPRSTTARTSTARRSATYTLTRRRRRPLHRRLGRRDQRRRPFGFRGLPHPGVAAGRSRRPIPRCRRRPSSAGPRWRARRCRRAPAPGPPARRATPTSGIAATSRSRRAAPSRAPERRLYSVVAADIG